MWDKFYRGFVVIPTDLYWFVGVGYRERGLSPYPSIIFASEHIELT
ncbi:hypothetical protein LEP1GSC074_1076 [Leptospira noguchii str. Hook]|nr:hypothetical protein LEP1GSC074_1076 [Leptospira noguchii str. Hook]